MVPIVEIFFYISGNECPEYAKNVIEMHFTDHCSDSPRIGRLVFNLKMMKHVSPWNVNSFIEHHSNDTAGGTSDKMQVEATWLDDQI